MEAKFIDINVDVGEGIGNESILMPIISSCNIACGGHAGDSESMRMIVKLATANNVKIGAHPSFPDKANFGRKQMDISCAALYTSIKGQIDNLMTILEQENTRLNHVKPHGALYNDMVANEQLAEQVVQLIKSIDPNLKIMTLAHSQVIDICKKNEMPFIQEGFADRRYQKINQLRNRRLEGAVLENSNDVLEQIQNFIDGKVQLYNLEYFPIQVQSICLHSDTKGAVNLSRMIHDFLKEKNIAIA